MAATMFRAAVLLLMFITCVLIASAQLNIVATTFPDRNPNTFVATSNQIGSSLLGSGVASLLWLVVKSSDVTAACKQIVGTGSMSFTVVVTDGTTGAQDDVSVQVTATGGCEAAPDESGTEMVWVDNLGRRAALVCPHGAGSTGCGVYITGAGITSFYNQHIGSRRRLLSRTERMNTECSPIGVVGGAVLGFYGIWIYAADCLPLPPPADLICVIAFLTTGTILGAVFIGCIHGSSCFPGDATLQLAGGSYKSMAELDLGDKVAVWRPDGTLGYEDIYGFGHRDAISAALFYKISMNSSKGLETSLELSGRHFSPVLSRAIGGQEMVYLRAEEIRPGDKMWALNDNAAALYTVTGITIKVKRGLYNPFTMTGTIVVNGVVSSVHSDWFLDKVFDKLGLTHLLPAAYQVVLAPSRMLYKVMGKKLYTVVYEWLDQHLNLVQHISDYSGIGASMIAAGAVVGAPSLYYLKKSTH